MSKQKLAAYAVCAVAGLGAMYLLATSPASPNKLDAFKTPATSPDSCTKEAPIANLHTSSIDQLRQLAEYQELCGSAVTKTLVADEDSDPTELREKAAKYGITVRTIKDLRTDTSVTWQVVETDSRAPLDTRARQLAAATKEAEQLQKQGKQVGFYLQAGGEYSYFGTSEPLLKEYLTRWYGMGVRLALSDHGEYSGIHDHEH